MIPKIIHQTGPTKKEDWHPLWIKCQESWIKNFPDYEYKFWNDEDIDHFIKNEYPQYWETFSAFPCHIIKIDFFRFCLLDKFGGIYADLDYYCYKNFSDLLVSNAYIVENYFGNDVFENALMCSVPKSKFFQICMEKSIEKFLSVQTNKPQMLKDVEFISKSKDFLEKGLRHFLIFRIAGTTFLSSMYRQNKDLVSVLPWQLFNNLDYSYDKKYYCKHVHTNLWGSDNIRNMSKDKLKIIRNIVVDTYDFYHDYSKNEYKKFENKELNYDKNDTETYIGIPSTYF